MLKLFSLNTLSLRKSEMYVIMGKNCCFLETINMNKLLCWHAAEHARADLVPTLHDG